MAEDPQSRDTLTPQPARGLRDAPHERLPAARLTPARIGLARTGVSLATREALDFAEAHALARDAVQARLATAALLAELRALGVEVLAVHSAARDRAEYLRRPDLGRRLDPAARALLTARRARTASHPAEEPQPIRPARLAIVLADGLSALAVERHGAAVTSRLLEELAPAASTAAPTAPTAAPAASTGAPTLRDEWTLAPVVVAEQARVALGDDVAEALGADAVVVLIGERPGLSAADSLGAYVTWRPGPGTTDAGRNCISNIRLGGLAYAEAAQAIAWYLVEGRRAGATGVGLRAGEPAASSLASPVSHSPRDREELTLE